MLSLWCFNNHYIDHYDLFIEIIFVMDQNFIVFMDLILAQENVELRKNQKKAYELNKHFQDTWGVKFPWEKSILNSNGNFD